MYWCALIRIRFAQINQTFHSSILVFIIVVSLHFDAYLRSLTLSHKIGGEQNVLEQYNLAKNVLDQFFSLVCLLHAGLKKKSHENARE